MTTAVDDNTTMVAPLRLVLLRLARRIRQHANAGLTPSRLSALSTIERHGPIRLGELGERERIGKSTVTRLAAKLEAEGHIHRVTDPVDARSSLVDLTDDGRELLEAASERADAYLARQVAALSDDERRQLAEILPVLERILQVKA